MTSPMLGSPPAHISPPLRPPPRPLTPLDLLSRRKRQDAPASSAHTSKQWWLATFAECLEPTFSALGFATDVD